MAYAELDFEHDLCDVLVQQGWSDGLLNNLPVHRDGVYDKNNIRSLEENFRSILDKNNVKELGGVSLSDPEFERVLDVVSAGTDTPVKANILLNGGRISIDRDMDSPDKAHAGRPVFLEIFDHQAIGTGNSVYQIARQVKFETGKHVQNRRGDVTLLINGLPVIHLELKTASVGVGEALNQVQKYLQEGVFRGLMGFVQVFFAMTPDDAVYFANYGNWNLRNDAFVFRWATAPHGDVQSEPVTDWRSLCGQNGKSYGMAMLSIPEAHQFVGTYTVADVRADKDGKKGPEQVANGTMMVLRYYQYHAINAMLRRVEAQKWGDLSPLGGICWCTTGGGKTLSSFKAGEAIIDRNLADKVVFLVDRTELDNQSLLEYNAFAREGRPVTNTKNSKALFKSLKSDDGRDTMVITSIQKMDRIVKDPEAKRMSDLARIRGKRIVFIVDEAQRSQFGDMHGRVKDMFPTALYFGFTGTPIMGGLDDARSDDSRKVFGDYISVYTISDGIRDGNVLGFAPKGMPTYKDSELKHAVARRQTKCSSLDEARKDKRTEKAYLKILDLKMPESYEGQDGKVVKGIEGYLSNTDYDNDNHRRAVMAHIKAEWPVVSVSNGVRLHGMLSTSSVDNVIEYYKLFQEYRDAGWDIKFTALFDSHASNDAKAADRSAAIKAILDDYEALYGNSYEPDDDGIALFKKDVMDRLAHKGRYANLDDEEMLDIVIVDDQLLVGYDSKYLSTLFLDRVLESHKLIQAISRTNRVLGSGEVKPFGQVRFFRKVHTMWDLLNDALKLYCQGDNTCAQAPDVQACLDGANQAFENIKKIFESDGVKNFIRLPQDSSLRMKFRAEFRNLKEYLNMARLQGCETLTSSGGTFAWDDKSLAGQALKFTPDECEVLHMRFLDTSEKGPKEISGRGTLTIGTNLSEVEMDKIDYDYLEKHFGSIAPRLADPAEPEDVKDRLVSDLRNDFGKLSELQQKHALDVLEDIRSGGLEYVAGKLFREYILEHMERVRSAAVELLADRYGLDRDALDRLCRREPDESSLNDGLEFNKLVDGIDVAKAGAYYGLAGFKAKRQAYGDLKDFVLNGWRKA